MSAGPNRPLRVVVCGTVFGRFYLEAVRRAAPEFTLAAVLAGGSARSRACAAEYGVPYYTSVDQLPGGIDVACVVVRSAVAGGPGGELAQALIARGLHVLQEQPAHPDEVAACLRLAAASGVHYQLNSFYPHLEPVRRFLRYARTLRSLRTVRLVDAASAGQVLFPLLDIIGRAVGGLGPWAFADPAASVAVQAITGVPAPVRLLHGAIAGVPLTLRIHNQLDPMDPDNHAPLLHQIALSTDAGTLTLADTHGPVLWIPRLHVNRTADGALALVGPGTDRLDQPTASVLDGETDTFRRAFAEMWPAGIRSALGELRAAVLDGERRTGRCGQYALTLSRMWHDLTTRLGRPELMHGVEAPPLWACDLAAEVSP